VTVIAAKVYDDKIVMSCDSMATRGYHHRKSGFPEKIIEGQDFLAGVCGDASVMSLLMMFAKNHPIGEGGVARVVEWCAEFLEFAKNKTDSWGGDASLVLAHRTGLFIIDGWIPLAVKDWCAHGSGYQHAEAALYLGHDTEKAVDVAVNMAYGCGGNIVTKSISTKCGPGS
jgi:ATP-dependent protease HslVU (ClpYQ) peptidase subunit